MEAPIVLTVDMPRLDFSNSAAFGERLSLALGEDGSNHVIIDFKSVQAISSMAFRELLLALKKATAGNGVVAVAGLWGIAREAFNLSRLDVAFRTFDSLADAQRAFADGSIHSKRSSSSR